MATKDFPYVPKELLQALEGRFKDTIPDIPTPPEEFCRLQGEQRVIRFLRAVYEKQTREILES